MYIPQGTTNAQWKEMLLSAPISVKVVIKESNDDP